MVSPTICIICKYNSQQNPDCQLLKKICGIVYNTESKQYIKAKNYFSEQEY